MFSELLLNGSALKHVQQQQKSREKGHSSSAAAAEQRNHGGSSSGGDDGDDLVAGGRILSSTRGSSMSPPPLLSSSSSNAATGGSSRTRTGGKKAEADYYSSSSSPFPMERSTALDVRPVQDVVLPGPAMRDTAPLRQLFSDHVEQVCRIPVILNNMPRYYAIVGSALDSALEQAEFELRTQNVQFQAEVNARKGTLSPADDAFVDDKIDDMTAPLIPSSCAEPSEEEEGEQHGDGDGNGEEGYYSPSYHLFR